MNALSLTSVSSSEKCFSVEKPITLKVGANIRNNSVTIATEEATLHLCVKVKKMGDRVPKATVKGKFMKRKDQMKKRQIHKMDTSTERSDDDSTSDTDTAQGDCGT